MKNKERSYREEKGRKEIGDGEREREKTETKKREE